MKRKEYIKRVKEIISEQLCIDIKLIGINTDIYDDLGADSLDMVDLVIIIEDEFEIEIPNESIKEDMKVRDIVDLIENCVDKKLHDTTCDTCK